MIPNITSDLPCTLRDLGTVRRPQWPRYYPNRWTDTYEHFSSPLAVLRTYACTHARIPNAHGKTRGWRGKYAMRAGNRVKAKSAIVRVGCHRVGILEKTSRWCIRDLFVAAIGVERWTLTGEEVSAYPTPGIRFRDCLPVGVRFSNTIPYVGHKTQIFPYVYIMQPSDHVRFCLQCKAGAEYILGITILT